MPIRVFDKLNKGAQTMRDVRDQIFLAAAVATILMAIMEATKLL